MTAVMPPPIQATSCTAEIPCPDRYCAMSITVTIDVKLTFHPIKGSAGLRREIRPHASFSSQPIWDHMLREHGPAED